MWNICLALWSIGNVVYPWKSCFIYEFSRPLLQLLSRNLGIVLNPSSYHISSIAVLPVLSPSFWSLHGCYIGLGPWTLQFTAQSNRSELGIFHRFPFSPIHSPLCHSDNVIVLLTACSWFPSLPVEHHSLCAAPQTEWGMGNIGMDSHCLWQLRAVGTSETTQDCSLFTSPVFYITYFLLEKSPGDVRET